MPSVKEGYSINLLKENEEQSEEFVTGKNLFCLDKKYHILSTSSKIGSLEDKSDFYSCLMKVKQKWLFSLTGCQKGRKSSPRSSATRNIGLKSSSVSLKCFFFFAFFVGFVRFKTWPRETVYDAK